MFVTLRLQIYRVLAVFRTGSRGLDITVQQNGSDRVGFISDYCH